MALSSWNKFVVECLVFNLACHPVCRLHLAGRGAVSTEAAVSNLRVSFYFCRDRVQECDLTLSVSCLPSTVLLPRASALGARVGVQAAGCPTDFSGLPKGTPLVPTAH